jgi:RNA recognition motif-containing protein
MAQKLFVGSLSFSTTSEGLREFFAQAGNVTSATVITDQFSGRSRGFGFVEMSTPEEAQAAVQRLNGKDLDGRQIKVEIAKPAGSGGGGGGPRRGPGGGGGGGRGGFGGGGGGGRPGGGGPGGGSRGNRW